MNLNTLANTELFRLYVENGSKEAINIFFQNQMDLFYRVAYKYTKNAADAEDVLQSAFMSIMDTAYQYKGLQSNEEKLLQSWCLSVVVHCSLMKMRTDSNRRNRETNYSTANAKPFYEENSMEKNSENEAIHKKVQDAIIQLPEKYRIPIHLKYVEGFELDAIANILKLNGNTLRSLIKRGLEKVSAQLKEENVTLGSVGLIGLIQGLPVEKAPFAYQSIATKMLDTANQSQRLLLSASPKAALLSTKIILSIGVVCVAIIGGVYSWKQFTSNNSTVLMGPVAIVPPLYNNALKYTNQTWEFNNVADRNLTLLDGKWEWSNSIKGMETKINTGILFSLPIVPQNKAFMVEFEMVAQKEASIDGVHFNGYWYRNNYLIKHDYFLSKERYNVDPGSKQNSFKMYSYNGYLFNFINDKCYQINKYSQDLEGANLSIGILNFVVQKITSQTFDSPPEKLLDAIKNPPTAEPIIHDDCLIEESKKWKANNSNGPKN